MYVDITYVVLFHREKDEKYLLYVTLDWLY